MTEVSYGHMISFIDQSGVKSAPSVLLASESLAEVPTLRAGLFYPDKQNFNDFLRCPVVLWEV